MSDAQDRALHRHRALADESRLRILALLRRGPGPLDSDELAVGVRLHVNTVRSHLRVLEDAGLVEHAVDRQGLPGRPRVVYRATADDTADGSYRLLAEILAASVAGTTADPGALARQAGKAWGRRVAEGRGCGDARSAREGVRRIVALLEDLGFAPEVEMNPGSKAFMPTRISLRRCPFRDVAEEHPEVVCGVHLGLLRGAMEAWKAPVRAERLDAFVEPDRCVAQLARRAPP